ncbi:hypothetical protein Ahy_B05g075485 isoform B [Arachis hypogaea]|uniref:Uncharacterized protein n=1 Tax=Arachis hypogaea TaxID=3818 RepID=A0A444Z1B1_ARAHY|nr:hypothetical protein Ahy_B05g075485 isoform B [Arachis hypogaea]
MCYLSLQDAMPPQPYFLMKLMQSLLISQRGEARSEHEASRRLRTELLIQLRLALCLLFLQWLQASGCTQLVSIFKLRPGLMQQQQLDCISYEERRIVESTLPFYPTLLHCKNVIIVLILTNNVKVNIRKPLIC